MVRQFGRLKVWCRPAKRYGNWLVLVHHGMAIRIGRYSIGFVVYESDRTWLRRMGFA